MWPSAVAQSTCAGQSCAGTACEKNNSLPTRMAFGHHVVAANNEGNPESLSSIIRLAPPWPSAP
eukprot:6841450-Pyramimonas_sp.AAC.1